MQEASNVINMAARGVGRTLRVSVGATGSTQGHGSKRVHNRMMTWTDLVERLDAPVRTTETVAEYHRMGKDAQLAVKDQGYFLGGHCEGGIRKKHNMPERDVLALDGDFGKPGWQDDLLDSLLGFAYCAHTTHKSNETEPRFRLLMPLARPVSEFEYALLCRHVTAMVDDEQFDPAGNRWVQAMFWPSVSRDGVYTVGHQDGAWLDIEDVKSQYADWRDVDQWPGADREAKALRFDVKKQGDPREKRGAVGAFCRVYDIFAAMDKFLPEAYEPTGSDNRFSYTDGTSRNGAIIYEQGQFLYSHHGSDPCGGMLVNAFDMVRLHRFGELDREADANTPIKKMPSNKAMEELAKADPEVRKEMVGDRINDDPLDDFEAIERTADAAPQPDTEADNNWHGLLALSDDGRIRATLLNAVVILRNDSKLKDRISYDNFAGGIKAGAPLPNYKSAWNQWPAEWADEMDLGLRIYLAKKYEVEFSGPMMADAVTKVANDNPRHAVLDWLKGLQWDGIDRAQRLWIDYFRTPDTPYYRETAEAFLVGAVLRVLKPGSKFDYVPIIEGLQGVRKSTFWEVLSHGHFTELRTFDTKQASEILQGVWIAEVPELDPFNRHEVEAVKAFFTEKAPRFRGAFRRHAGTAPRQCVFGGTTNKRGGYLKDPTGNRRFWPLGYVEHMIDTDLLAAEAEQIWAEAYELATNGAKPFLSAEAEALAQAEQQKREQVDEWTGAIQEWLDKPASTIRYSDAGDDFDGQTPEMEDRDRTCIPELWVDCLQKSIDALKPWDRSRIRAAVEATGRWRATESVRRFGTRFGRQKSIERIK